MGKLEDNEDYLGDGVYVTDTGYGVRLDLRMQPDYNMRDDKNQIALEPNVLKNLVEFYRRVSKNDKAFR